MNADGDITRYAFYQLEVLSSTSMTTIDLFVVNSHLMGMFTRTIRLMEHGIRPVYVFDGKPPEMKSGEVCYWIEERWSRHSTSWRKDKRTVRRPKKNSQRQRRKVERFERNHAYRRSGTNWKTFQANSSYESNSHCIFSLVMQNDGLGWLHKAIDLNGHPCGCISLRGWVSMCRIGQEK